jgi:hypothetical protein
MVTFVRVVVQVVLALLLVAWALSIVMPLAAIHAAATGYWGPEWGDPTTDAVAWSLAWVFTGAVLLTALRWVSRRGRPSPVDVEDDELRRGGW